MNAHAPTRTRVAKLSCLRITFWLKPQNDLVDVGRTGGLVVRAVDSTTLRKMPSESAKRRQAQKKDRERQRQQQASARKKQQPPKQEEEEKPQVNGVVGACAAAGPVDDVQVKSKAVDKKAAARSCTGELLLLYVRPSFYAYPCRTV